MRYILFRAIDGYKAKTIPSCATTTRSEAIGFFNGILAINISSVQIEEENFAEKIPMLLTFLALAITKEK